MADVNLQLVREFFELSLFRVLTNWQQGPWRERTGEPTPRLFVENVQPGAARELSFVLHPADVTALERAVVHVRAWHTDRFYPSVIESSPVLSGLDDRDEGAMADAMFDGRPFATLLVISELPVARDLKERSIGLLRAAGVDHVIEFPQLLQELLRHVRIDANYSASPTLQTLRLLKRYKLIRNQQLEFSFPTEPPVPERPPMVDAQSVSAVEGEEEEDE